MSALFLRRSAVSLSQRAIRRPAFSRPFTTSLQRRDTKSDKDAIEHPEGVQPKDMKPFEEIEGPQDLLPPGAQPGTVPTDLEQATGLERLEVLGKMQGVDIFDMRPLDASRKGTLDDPIMVRSFGDEQYIGCTGCPVDSHIVRWLTLFRKKRDGIARCNECGSVYKMDYVGIADDQEHGHGHDAHGHDAHGHGHGHDAHHGYEEPKTFSDFIRPEYRW